jgi:hypothetical protein
MPGCAGQIPRGRLLPTGKILNPAVEPFVLDVRNQTEPVWRNFTQVPFIAGDQFASLVHEAQEFIQCAIKEDLSWNGRPIGLSALSEICGRLDQGRKS